MKTHNLFVLCASVLAAGLLFWPTVYRYDKTDDGFVRTNRLTGDTAILKYGTWFSAPKETPLRARVWLPIDELAKLTGNSDIRAGTFSGKIYNGSDWWVERVYLVVTAKEPSGKVRWSREVSADLNADPLETKFFSASVTGDEGIGSTDWSVKAARGYKADDKVPPRYRQVQGPDGPIDFPSSMNDEQVKQAMRKLYPPKMPTPAKP